MLSLLLIGFGWDWERRRGLVRWCVVGAISFLLALPVGLFFLRSGPLWSAQATRLDLASVLAFAPTFFATSLGLSAAVLSRDWRGWLALATLALVVTLGLLRLANLL